MGVSDPITRLLVDAAGAVGIGLLIGLEREHRDRERRDEGNVEILLGVRTFALIALFGWTCAYLSDLWPWLAPVALLVTAALAALSFLRTRDLSHGLTTEVAALVTFNLGLLVHHHRPLAISLGVLTTLLLISKPWFGALVPRLRRVDLTATLQFLIVLAIVLPLLPVEARDPWGVLSPRRIGLFVTLVAGMQYVGYVLGRVLGPGRSAALTGVVGGLISSTAVTAAMAQQARASEAMLVPAQMASLLASAVMAVRIVVLLAFVAAPVALAAMPAMAALGGCLLGAALWLRRAGRAEAIRAVAAVEVQNPMSLVPALKLGAVLTVVLVLAAVGHDWLGDRGVIGAAALAGLADVDAIVLAVGRSVSSGQLPSAAALLAVIVAAGSNTIVKTVIAWWSGGRRFACYLAVSSGVALAAALGVSALAW
jgi:uncharacterized membrane protein (DUF4010 family)